jgi:hypothetical protein
VVGVQVTKTDFTFQLVTIRSKKSFAEVTGEIERLFQRYDVDKLEELSVAGDAETLAAYVKKIGAQGKADRSKAATSPEPCLVDPDEAADRGANT